MYQTYSLLTQIAIFIALGRQPSGDLSPAVAPLDEKSLDSIASAASKVLSTSVEAIYEDGTLPRPAVSFPFSVELQLTIAALRSWLSPSNILQFEYFIPVEDSRTQWSKMLQRLGAELTCHI